MTYTYIHNNQELQSFLSQEINETVISIDTEFVRKNTYYPKLGLVQIGFKNHVYIIDGLFCDIKLLKNMLYTPNVIKVFHSARQDLEILFRIFSDIPGPVFDLQIAANVTGIASQPSLDTLFKHFFDKNLNKDLQDTDWLMRPLTPQMLEYAYQDARAIYDIYSHLKIEDSKNLKKHNDLLEKIIYAVRDENPADKIAAKFKHVFSKKEQINLSKKIIHWREKNAMHYDRPREHILPQSTIEELIRVNDLTKKIFKSILFKSPCFTGQKRELRLQLWEMLNLSEDVAATSP